MFEELLLYFPYLGIFLLLLLGGIGLPFPEDLTLLLAGQLAFSKELNLPILFIICFVGVISTDMFLFYIGRKYGRVLFRYRFFRRIFTPQRRVQVKREFKKHGDKVVFIARFLGGFRTPVFLTAGTLKMGYARFFLLDFSASLLSIPLFILGSYYVGQKFEEIAHGLATKITVGLMGLMGVFFLFVLWRWHLQTRKEVKN